MTSVQHSRTFGRPVLPHTVIIARGDTVRHFTVRPWLLGASTALATALVVGCLGAASYLALHDDIVASGGARQARLQQAYEDRIATLRTELDRVVSRQLLDREKVETKVDTLIGQQAELAARYEKLQPLIDRARSNGLIPTAIPIPEEKPANDRHAAFGGDRQSDGASPLAYAEGPAAPLLGRFGLVDKGSRQTPGGDASWMRDELALEAVTAHDPVSRSQLIREIGRSIDSVEDRQVAGLASLVGVARAKADGIIGVLKSEGIRMPVDAPPAPSAGQGGPFVAVPKDQRFSANVAELETALGVLQSLHETTRQLPLGEPVSAAPVSSTFGVRADPFLGRSAMHTGIDFVALNGTGVKATAAGVVVAAGVNGGYGNMVEVDHGGGVITRYAHLSETLVVAGDRIAAGDIVGRVGSTGRSTGPHLHYEVRRDGAAIDPTRFLRAGRRIGALG